MQDIIAIPILDQERKQDTGVVGSGNMKYTDFFLNEAKTVRIRPEKVTETEARRIYRMMNYKFDFNEFHKGMNVEMEHKDVTKGDLKLTAMIAAAHLTEVPNYYTLLQKYVETKK